MIHCNDYCQKVSCWCGRGSSLVPIWRHFSSPAGCDFADEMFPCDSLAWSFAKRCSPLQFVASSVQPIRIPPPWPGETGCSALYVINRKFVQFVLEALPHGMGRIPSGFFPLFFLAAKKFQYRNWRDTQAHNSTVMKNVCDEGSGRGCSINKRSDSCCNRSISPFLSAALWPPHDTVFSSCLLFISLRSLLLFP